MQKADRSKNKQTLQLYYTEYRFIHVQVDYFLYVPNMKTIKFNEGEVKAFRKAFMLQVGFVV